MRKSFNTGILTGENFKNYPKTMSRAIICFAIVVVLSSIGNGRVIDKRSPQGYIYILGLLLIYQTYLYKPCSGLQAWF